MFIYTVLVAIFAIALGILLATRTKFRDGVVYGRLDRAGRITNIGLTILYACLSPFYMLLGMIAAPAYDGFLGFLGWVVAIIAASAALPCGVGIGASVALRKRGKSRLSFVVQFAGVLGILITLVIFLVFYGNLLSPLN